MKNPSIDDDELDPAAARMVARVRAMMLIAGLSIIVMIAVVLVVIGYRFFHLQGSAEPAAPADLTAQLPKGARVIGTTAAGDRIVVTIETGGATEVRMFDLHTLRPAGTLRLNTER